MFIILTKFIGVKIIHMENNNDSEIIGIINIFDIILIGLVVLF